MSDDQLMDKTLKMYEARHGKPFTLVHWWRTLKNQPKWCAYVAQLAEKEKNKSMPIDIADDSGGECLIGRDAAKAQHNGKSKAEEVMDCIVLLGENVNKKVAVQQECKQEREKVTKAQLEITRLQLKTAKEHKEAWVLEVYNSLLRQDTSQMTKDMKANREKILAKMEHKLLGGDEEE
ncbi:hypothetical protein E2562_018649 [Oryza meyeriana var. granulata]|uniref:Uncharacterized protein n=1 Tax=Oryza meyeriana var. granulata TaxID=110450 RepID=A0A6G1BY86_9ORYZ|nr:hypothetical protein E2562_018649 [Oryza meyeriana var. granulata]